jgi:hypothetical protein
MDECECTVMIKVWKPRKKHFCTCYTAVRVVLMDVS